MIALFFSLWMNMKISLSIIDFHLAMQIWNLWVLEWFWILTYANNTNFSFVCRDVPEPKPKQESTQSRGQPWGQADQRSSGGQSWGHSGQMTAADQFPDDDDGLDELMLEELETLERQQAQQVSRDKVAKYKIYEMHS